MPRRAFLPLPLLAGCSASEFRLGIVAAPGSRELRDLRYGDAPRNELDLTLPSGPPRALLVFLYGGGWDSGARGRYRFLARTLAADGLACAIPDYRVWPGGRWPDVLEDAALAVRWARARPELDRVPCFVMGHSAGAMMAMALALDPRWLGAERTSLAGAIGLAGVYRWRPAEQPLATIFAAAPDGIIDAAPADAALRDAPPALLLHGQADTTVRPAQSIQLAERLRAAGSAAALRLYPGIGHIGIVTAMVGPLRALGLARAPVLDDVRGFLDTVLNPGETEAGGGNEPGGPGAVVLPESQSNREFRP